MKMNRREMLLSTLVLIVSGKMTFDIAKKAYYKYLEHRIYHELPRHIHISHTYSDLSGWRIGFGYGAGIVVDKNYITPAHIVGEVTNEDYDIAKLYTMLYGKKLKKSYISKEDDIAIFELPSDLHIPNFPAEVSNDISLGDEIYVVGNPRLEGTNVRKANISSLRSFDEEVIKKCFSVDTHFIKGDSGTPIVNKDFKLVGMCLLDYYGIGYAKRLGEYLK